MTKTISIQVGEDVYKILKKRAKKQGYETVEQLTADILRRSVITTKTGISKKAGKPLYGHDPLIEAFSRRK